MSRQQSFPALVFQGIVRCFELEAMIFIQLLMVVLASFHFIRAGSYQTTKSYNRFLAMSTFPRKLSADDSNRLLRRIAELNECDNNKRKEYIPFHIGDQIYGFVKQSLRPQLNEHQDVFSITPTAIHLKDSLLQANLHERSTMFHKVSESLLQSSAITQREWRDEMVPVKRRFSDTPAMLIERAAYPLFGLKGYGVHINGYVKDQSGRVSHLWVARRSKTKSTFPSMLDHIVAGGQPEGISPLQNVIKECAEEANIPADLAASAQAVSAVSYVGVDGKDNMKRDVLFCYDLELPASFIPRPVDGEVESFELKPIDWVIEKILEGGPTGYKPNCNLVIIDFLIR